MLATSWSFNRILPGQPQAQPIPVVAPVAQSRPGFKAHVVQAPSVLPLGVGYVAARVVVGKNSMPTGATSPVAIPTRGAVPVRNTNAPLG